MSTDYRVPADDRPRLMVWDARTDAYGSPTDVRWWQQAEVHHGGRNASVVIDSKGEMAVFHDDELVGVTEAPFEAHPPTAPEFWPLEPRAEMLDTWISTWSHYICDTEWMVAEVDGVLGLAARTNQFTYSPWSLGDAFTRLGYFPALTTGSLEWRGDAQEWAFALEVFDERTARRVKRALVGRLAHDRRTLRDLSTRMETYWK